MVMKIKGFKEFAFPKVDEALLEKVIAQSLKVSPQLADILSDYYETDEALYLGLRAEKFNQTALLGEHYRTLEGLDKKDKAILSTLCTKGSSMSKQERPNLTKLGIIHYGGYNYWESAVKILNYELNTGVNCVNVKPPQDVLNYLEGKREAERRAREAEEKRKEDERRAQERIRLEQQKLKNASAAQFAKNGTKPGKPVPQAAKPKPTKI